MTIDDVAQNDFNLNISLYVEPVLEEETITVREAIANLKSEARRGLRGRGPAEGAAGAAGLMS